MNGMTIGTLVADAVDFAIESAHVDVFADANVSLDGQVLRLPKKATAYFG